MGGEWRTCEGCGKVYRGRGLDSGWWCWKCSTEGLPEREGGWEVDQYGPDIAAQLRAIREDEGKR